jgi:radical SAM superfamily enzyme YgiQ (UPF0313 family)
MTYDIIIFTDMGARLGHIKPLGAYRLASELRSHGYSVKVLDYTGRLMSNQLLFQSLLDGLIGANTLFVGWSSTFFGGSQWGDSWEDNLYPTDESAFKIWLKYIKKKNPNTKIAYGGTRALETADLVDEIDYVVVGLADKVVVDLANHLKNNTALKYRPSFNKRWKILDYDPVGAGFDFKNSQTQFEDTDHVALGETLIMETSRGCMFKCKFCSYPLLGRKKTDPEYHKHQDCISNELRRNWEKFGVKRYLIVDDTFNETVGKLESIVRARDAAGVDVELTSYLRLDLVARYPEQIQLFKEMNLTGAFFGVESFNEQSAASIGKSGSSDRLKETLYQIKDKLGSQFSSTVSFIAGLPYETPETLTTAMDWVSRHESPVDNFTFRELMITDSVWPSEFLQNYKKYGYTLDQNSRWSNDIWNQEQAGKLAKKFNDIGYTSGKNKSTNFHLFYIALNKELSEFKDIPMKDLDRQQIAKDTDNTYIDYVKSMLNFENITFDREKI